MLNLSARAGRRFGKLAILGSLACAAASPAFAVTSITSDATGLKVNVSAVGATATVGPLGTASGTATAGGSGYNVSTTTLGINQSLSLATLLSQSVSTGVLTASASSPFPTVSTGTASSNVDGLTLGLGALLGINFSAIGSTTTFDGTNFTGVSTLANLSLTGLSLLSIPVNAAAIASSGPNAVVLNALGLKLVLNEQIASSSQVGSAITNGLTTNALHLTYTNFLASGNLLNGDIIVGQSHVAVTSAVPETGTWAMMIVGFGGIGFALRSQRKPNMRIA